MIQVKLEPTELRVNQPNELTIRLTNTGHGKCTNVIFKLTLPVQLVLLQGADRIDIPKLEAGQSITHTLRVRPKLVGSLLLTSSNFSYRDVHGKSHRVSDMRVTVTVAPESKLAVKLYPYDSNRITAKPEILRTLRVFLCHSSGDKPVVRKLYRHLRDDEMDPWLDEEKLLPGQDWSQEIAKIVRTSDVVIVCLSRGLVDKAGYVQKEIKFALDSVDEQPEGTIFLIPLKLEECEVPERLRRWQWVNYFDENGYKRLVDALRIRAQNLGVKAPPEMSLSQVLDKYEGQRIKVNGNDRKDQYFVFKGELHYIDLGAVEVCENSSLLCKILDEKEEFILSQAVRGENYNALQMKAVVSEVFPSKNNEGKSVISILLLAADPTDASRLRLGEELREIQEKLQLSTKRDRFQLHQRMSVRPEDISQALLDVQPQIVHFSGHGLTTGVLCFESRVGKIQPVEPDALAALFEQFAAHVDCVVLNACYSEIQASAIAQYIEYVIGMNQAIGDKAAIAFAIGFYQALGAGRTIEEAYKLGCVQIRLQHIPEHLTPVLIKHEFRQK